MTGVIRWEDPGPRVRADGPDYAAMADELRSRPGEWAVIREGIRATVATLPQSINKGTLTAFRPAGTFESTSRARNNTVSVYARYIGDPP